ncbi:hypothetical protein [Streptomyces zaomyceticus]|uniref:hypothetical protein n=1 Tax=Streptomyces zaomyceticus TaxID=68286 RepID=UPI003792FCFE
MSAEGNTTETEKLPVRWAVIFLWALGVAGVAGAAAGFTTRSMGGDGSATVTTALAAAMVAGIGAIVKLNKLIGR